jgi:hypothetical protein
VPIAATGPGWSTRARVAGLAAIVLVSLGAHLWGLTRDLPLPDVDERYFVTPAAYVAASGDPNPHWFGHPGSTVIYPLAFAFRVRETVFHGAPLTGAAPAVAERFRADPGSFYLLGRLWAMLFSLAVLPLLFVVGRRVFGDLVAFLATAVWAVIPLAVQYGRITRTDSVALFFALLTIWACLRALDRPSRARFAVAGVAAGFGIATRYFLAALAVLLFATWLGARKQQRAGRSVVNGRYADAPVPASTIAISLTAMLATFVLTTPYLFIDWHDALTSLTAETGRIPFQSHGLLDNLGYYVTQAIPGALSWIGLTAALFGVGLALLRRTPAKTLLLAWVACVLIVISVLPLHWNRWVIPALPILVLFGTSAMVALARAIAARWQRPAPRRWVFVATAGIAMLAITIGPATALVALDRTQAEQSTRVAARTWIERHIPAGDRIAEEIKGPDLTNTRYPHVEHYALPLAGSIADYARAGYRYLVINARIADRYRAHPREDHPQRAFYDFLREDARRVADFRTERTQGGPHLELYDIGPTRTPREKPEARGADVDEITLRTTARNRVTHGSGPVPFARHALHRLAIEAGPS